AREERDIAAGDLAHDVVARVGDVDVARRIERDAAGAVQRGAGGRGAVAAAAQRAGAGDGGDRAAGDHADAVIGRVRDVDDALRIDGDRVRIVELGGGWIAVVGEARAAVAGYRRDGVLLAPGSSGKTTETHNSYQTPMWHINSLNARCVVA